MITLTLAEVARAVNGVPHDVQDLDSTVTGPVVVDSREVRPGALFTAVVGERVDGHDFAAQAVSDGAVAVLASRPVGVPALVVDDVVEALGRLARAVVERLPQSSLVALTGSSGKTSTKDLIGQLLTARGQTVFPRGSFNNEIGLPLTALRAQHETRHLVLEMGARGKGHIRYLASLTPPRIGVVLNVGTAHVGEFGSREAIAAAKGELVESLPEDGAAVLNIDDPLVRAMASRTSASVVFFGESDAADVRAVDVRLDRTGCPGFTLVTPDGRAPVQLGMMGEHQVSNALAAAAVAYRLRMTPEAIASGLGDAVPLSRWRMEVTDTPDGVTVVNDAYNANPDSMRAALRAVATMARARPQAHSYAVLGPMLELGEESMTEHDAVGRMAVRLNIGTLVAVGGTEAAWMELGARNEGSFNEESVQVSDGRAAFDLLRKRLCPGDVVLVKASRAAGLESVAEALLEGEAVVGPAGEEAAR